MSLRREIKPRARGDTVRQYRWYCKYASLDVAERYLAVVDARILKLSERAHLGVRCRFRSDRFQVYRFIPLERPFDAYPVFYRCDSTTLEVMRVLHSSRDIPRRLREENVVYGVLPSEALGPFVPASMMEARP